MYPYKLVYRFSTRATLYRVENQYLGIDEQCVPKNIFLKLNSIIAAHAGISKTTANKLLQFEIKYNPHPFHEFLSYQVL